jgi:arylsulfatase A-like enzyme
MDLAREGEHDWNQLCEQIFANQKRLGVIPPNTQLTPWPGTLPKWDTLSADEKKLFAREAEVFAAYAAYTDHEIGRVIQASRTWASSTTPWSSTSAATTRPAPRAPCVARRTR